ncbi:MAG: 6-phosphofructokinase [Actinomycetota bacterium]
MRIGVLTGGGDCPGLNAVIRALVRRGEREYGHEFVGIRHGWRGLVEDVTVPLSIATTRGILHRGGTILGTSRTNPYKGDGDGVGAVKATLARHGIDALVAIGGEDTLGVAERLGREGVRVVGVPKTIDNDLSGTDVTFGFDTAVQIAVDAIDRLHTTAESHDRVMVVEVMGRHAGWIALWSGIGGGADVVLVPERPFDLDAVCARLQRRHADGRSFSIVVVSEGSTPVEGTMVLQEAALDEFGHVRLGGIANLIGPEIEARTGYETRVTVLGHVLRGGTPTAFDRMLATRFGLEAAAAVEAGDFGTMVALAGNDIVRVPIADAVRELKTVPASLLDTMRVLLG